MNKNRQPSPHLLFSIRRTGPHLWLFRDSNPGVPGIKAVLKRFKRMHGEEVPCSTDTSSRERLSGGSTGGVPDVRFDMNSAGCRSDLTQVKICFRGIKPPDETLSGRCVDELHGLIAKHADWIHVGRDRNDAIHERTISRLTEILRRLKREG